MDQKIIIFPKRILGVIDRQRGSNLLRGGNTNKGRPSKYDERYIEEVKDHMSKGYSLESFAGLISVSRETLYEWQREHTDFSDAVAQGYAKSLLFFETLGIKGIAGRIKNFNNGTYALTMANKHKWKNNRTDLTTDDKPLEPNIIYLPHEEGENAKE